MQRLCLWSRRKWRLLAGLALSAICLYLAVRGLSLPSLFAAPAAARWQWVALVIVTALAGTLFKALRWRALLLPAQVPLLRTWSILLIGQMLNVVLPARAGEIGRIYYMGRDERVGSTRALSTVIIEKMADLMVLAFFYLLVAVWLAGMPASVPDWLRMAGLSLLPLAGLALAVLLLVAYGGRAAWRLAGRVLRPLPQRWQKNVNAAAEGTISAFEGLRKNQIMARVWSYSLVIWLLATLSNVLMFRAFQLTLAVPVALLLLVVLMSGVAVPPLPGNLGVFPYLCQLVLSLFGIERETGLILGLALQAATYLPVVVLGVACLLRENAALGNAPLEPSAPRRRGNGPPDPPGE